MYIILKAYIEIIGINYAKILRQTRTDYVLYCGLSDLDEEMIIV